MKFWMVVSNMFYFHPYLGKIPISTNIFQWGWNHQTKLAGAYTVELSNLENNFSKKVEWPVLGGPVCNLKGWIWKEESDRTLQELKSAWWILHIIYMYGIFTYICREFKPICR